jgi:hypothetical protein
MYLCIYDLPGLFFCGLRVLRVQKNVITAHGCRGRKDAQWNLRQETQNLSLTQRLARPFVSGLSSRAHIATSPEPQKQKLTDAAFHFDIAFWLA